MRAKLLILSTLMLTKPAWAFTPNGPDDAARVATIAASFRDQAAAAANDMAKGALRVARAKAMCSFIHGHPQDWEGTVKTLDSTDDGNGVLAIEIAPDVTFSTWDNKFSDMEDHSLIPSGSPLFTTAAALRVGQKVTFSGVLFHSQSDCMKEKSITMDGSLSAPDYLIRFSDVKPAPGD